MSCWHPSSNNQLKKGTVSYENSMKGVRRQATAATWARRLSYSSAASSIVPGENNVL